MILGEFVFYFKAVKPIVIITFVAWTCLVRVFKQQFSVFLEICVSEKMY